MIRIGPYTFTDVRYDAFNDELDAYVDGRSGGVGKSAKELHVWYYADEDYDELIGVTLNGARLMLKKLGAVKVTLPDGDTVEAEGVAEYLEGLPGHSDWPELD
jgi:hypothetical protein